MLGAAQTSAVAQVGAVQQSSSSPREAVPDGAGKHGAEKHNQQTQSDVRQSAPKVAVQESAQQSSKQSGSAGLSSAQMCKGGVLQMSETSHISPGLSQGQSRGNPDLSQQAGKWLARSVVTMPSGGSSLTAETDRAMVWRVDPQTCWREQLLQANIAYIAVHSARVRAQLAEGSLPGAAAADGLDADGSLPEAEESAWRERGVLHRRKEGRKERSTREQSRSRKD
jgi:hypothetical protein